MADITDADLDYADDEVITEAVEGPDESGIQASDLDYVDGDEEQPVEATDETADEDEPVTEPQEEEAPEAEATEDNPDEVSSPEDTVYALPGDEGEISLAEIRELKASGLREADYTKKRQLGAEREREVESLAETYTERLSFAESALQNVASFVESLIPEEPSLELSRTNPAEYTQSLAIRNAAIKELQALTSNRQIMDQHKESVSEADLAARNFRIEAAIVNARPHLSDPVQMSQFEEANRKTAEEFGFSPDDYSRARSPQIAETLYYARLGKKAEANQANAKRRVMTPVTGRPKPAQPVSKTAKQVSAMKRLTKSGSIDDAMEIDF